MFAPSAMTLATKSNGGPTVSYATPKARNWTIPISAAHSTNGVCRAPIARRSRKLSTVPAASMPIRWAKTFSSLGSQAQPLSAITPKTS